MTGGNSGSGTSSKAWFPYWKPRPEARLRLFCFPFAGGSASIFQRWADLGPSVEVLAVQYPGRETRFADPPMRSVSGMAAALGPVMRPLLDRPFAFFGYSLGTLIALELAHWLRSEGAPAPRGLMLAAGAPPGLRRPRGLHTLQDKDFIDELRRYGGTPAEVLDHQELMEMLLPMLRADFEMVDTYPAIERPPLSVPIAVWGGTEDPEPAPPLLEGWRSFTTQDFTLQIIPGGHFFLFSAAEFLREDLTRTLTRWSSQAP